MMSQEQLERYRRMTNAQRLEFTLARIREEWKYLTFGAPAVVERRFALLKRRNDERNESLLQHLSQATERP